MDKIRFTTDQPLEEDFALQSVADVDELQMNFVRLKAHTDLPAHNSNSNVRLLVLEGEITVTVNDDQVTLGAHELASVAYDTPMQIRNLGSADAAFLVIKTPNPRVIAKAAG